MYRIPVLLAFLIAATVAHGQMLQRYTCVVDRLNVEGYDDPANSRYSKDPVGVIMDRGRYHPVRVAMYGILCHQKFLDTGDSSYLKKMLDQAAYYRDSTRWDVAFGGKGIGFPYSEDFHDLQAPWYSGMAQGAALSYLLRYREITGDHSFDDFMKKVAFFLIQREEEGGTISVDNGFYWVEEYPMSREARHVLNGGLNGFIGLGEYCQVFPGDRHASRVRDECYEFLLQRLPEYTKYGWSAYDLTDRMCNPNYMRYHIYQMKHMYELTGEELFRNTQMIWSALLDTVPFTEGIGVVNEPLRVLSRRVMPADHGWFDPGWNFETIEQGRYKIESLQEVYTGEFKDVSALVAFKRKDSVRYLSVGVPNAAAVQGIQMYSVTPRLHEPEQITAQYQLLEGKIRILLDSTFILKGPNKLLVVFEGLEKSDIVAADWQIYKVAPGETGWPMFGHYYTLPNRLSNTATYKFELPNHDVKLLKVFYKYSETEEGLYEANFNPYQVFNEQVFTPEETGYYQFLVMYKFESLLSRVGMLTYSEVFD